MVRLVRLQPLLHAFALDNCRRRPRGDQYYARRVHRRPGRRSLFIYFKTKKWDTTAILNGFLAGLVGITCPCYWVSGLGACLIGMVAGVLVILAMDLLEHLRIDDPVGAWPVHGVCGIWGTLSLGLFACGQYSAAGSSPFGVPSIVAKSPDALTGLFYGGGTQVLAAQFVGSVIVCVATFASAMAMFAALNAVGLLRVSKEGELDGSGHRSARDFGLPRVRDLGRGVKVGSSLVIGASARLRGVGSYVGRLTLHRHEKTRGLYSCLHAGRRDEGTQRHRH